MVDDEPSERQCDQNAAGPRTHSPRGRPLPRLRLPDFVTRRWIIAMIAISGFAAVLACGNSALSLITVLIGMGVVGVVGHNL